MIGLVGLIDPAQLADEACRAWRPPPDLDLSDWAEAHFYLSAESAAEPGPWRTLPYQREPMNALTDPHILRVTFMKSARVGYTKMLNALIGYHIHHDPATVMLIQPTLDDAKGYSKEEIVPMLRDCPAVAAMLTAADVRRNSQLHMEFSRSRAILQIVGARSPASFRRVSRRIILGDEVDEYPISAGSQGDPIALAFKRSEHFEKERRKIVHGSTPTRSGASRIEQLYRLGDQRRYYVPCTQCGHMDYLAFRRARSASEADAGHLFAWTRGQPADAHFVCRDCGGLIEHRDKPAILAAGAWRAHAPFDPVERHASFHVWAAYMDSPNATWAQLAREFEETEGGGLEQLQVFVNTVLGETWAEPGEVPEWESLYRRREDYAIGTCPAGVLLLTAGVDVQKDRLVYEVVGWGRGKRSWSVDYGPIPGDTADLTATGPWAKLDALLERSFPTIGHGELRIDLLAVDSGFSTQTVYSWARRYLQSRVIAVKGIDAASGLIGSPSHVDVKLSGKRVGYKVWPIAGGVAKSELYGWLRLAPPLEDPSASPPGFCRFPEYDQEYFKQLTGEQLVAHKLPSGFTVHTWEATPGRENHVLDCRVYARAAAMLRKLDQFRETDWAALERRLGIETTPPPPDVLTTPPATPSAPPRRRVRSGWLHPRPEGWLRGRRR